MERQERLMVEQESPERKVTCLVACGRDLDDYEEIEKFTNTTDYDYVQAFIQGLNLVSKMPQASEC